MDKDPLPSRPRWGRRILLGAVGLFLLAILVLGVGYGYHRYRVSQELSAALAEALASDPILTTEELEALRAIIPPEQNSAPRILAAARLAGENVIDEELANQLEQAPANEVYPTATADALQAMLTKAAPALAELRGLENLPRGRHAVEWRRDYISTSAQHAFQTIDMVKMLGFHVMHLSGNDQIDKALTGCSSALNAGRSLGDEPMLISQLARAACLLSTLATLERVLAHGIPTGDSLENLQHDLMAEEQSPVLWIAIRAEHAGIHRIFEVIATGEMSISQLIEAPDLSELDELWGRERMRLAHPFTLRHMTRLLKIAQMPPHDREVALAALRQQTGQPPVMAAMLINSIEKAFGFFQMREAMLRLAITALACERYRLVHGRWPTSLNQLTPDFLPTVPMDPYDGLPLRLLPLHDGIQLYAIGSDLIDDGGTIDPRATKGVDLGFRLWDVDRRRLSAAP